jgi:hypothetical protein
MSMNETALSNCPLSPLVRTLMSRHIVVVPGVGGAPSVFFVLEAAADYVWVYSSRLLPGSVPGDAGVEQCGPVRLPRELALAILAAHDAACAVPKMPTQPPEKVGLFYEQAQGETTKDGQRKPGDDAPREKIMGCAGRAEKHLADFATAHDATRLRRALMDERKRGDILQMRNIELADRNRELVHQQLAGDRERPL